VKARGVQIDGTRFRSRDKKRLDAGQDRYIHRMRGRFLLNKRYSASLFREGGGAVSSCCSRGCGEGKDRDSKNQHC